MVSLGPLQRSWAIIQATWALPRKYPVLIKSAKYSLIFAFVYVILYCLLLWVLFGPQGILGYALPYPALVALIAIIALVLLSPPVMLSFAGNFFAAAHTYVVYKVARGENPTFGEGLARARQNLSDILYLTLFEMILKAILAVLRGVRFSLAHARGIAEFLLRLFFGSLIVLISEGLDLFRSFIIPAMINTDRTIFESLEDIKRIRDRWAESLVGILAFDFVGSALFSFVIFLSLSIFACGALLGLYVAPNPGPYQQAISFLAIMLFPTAILMLLLGTALISVLVPVAKNTYFTLLWMEINEPESLRNAPELEEYLQNAKQQVSGRPAQVIKGKTR